MRSSRDDGAARAHQPWWPRVWRVDPPLPRSSRPEAPPRETREPAAPPLAADEIARDRVRLVVLERARDRVSLHPFAELPALLRAGDLVVVNDAATLPASLRGATARGESFELRLSAPVDGERLAGVLFGAGDWRTRTEDRPSPPAIAIGERVVVGAVACTVIARDGRRIELAAHVPGNDADARRDALWQALYAAGAPVQYAHRRDPLALWSVQTAYAARPWAVEMPSAGRPLTWDLILALQRAGISIATVTHAAGLGSTGDAALDGALPWPERYEIPARAAAQLAEARARGGRVIAIGTSVVRALEASEGRAGQGTATLRLGPDARPRIVDGLISGLHVPGESHFDLLRAFAPADQLARVLELARGAGLSGHELGDACLVVP